jgi:hypothetical protein
MQVEGIAGNVELLSPTFALSSSSEIPEKAQKALITRLPARRRELQEDYAARSAFYIQREIDSILLI